MDGSAYQTLTRASLLEMTLLEGGLRLGNCAAFTNGSRHRSI